MITLRGLRVMHPVCCRTTRPALTAGRKFLSSTTSAQRPEVTTWVDRLPVAARPYVYLTRVDKPIGTLLLYYPCGRYRAHYAPLPFNKICSVVNHYGLLCPSIAIYNSTHISQPVRYRCSRNAWRRMHYQRYVGQES